MGRDKHDYFCSARGYLEHYDNECRLCKQGALISKVKGYFIIGIVAFLLLLLNKYGGYYEWLEKL